MGLTFRTADYPSPPVRAIVGTFNNPGCRYYVKAINPDTGEVTAIEWMAINADPFLIAVTPEKTYKKAEWCRLMDRWVLVKQPWATTFRSIPIQWVESLDDPLPIDFRQLVSHFQYTC